MRSIALLLVLCSFGLGGCSAETAGSAEAAGSAETAGPEFDQAPADTEPLQTVQVGLERLDFFDADGSIWISSTRPNQVPWFAIDVLEQAAGVQLTPLEIFAALAPEGLAPHDRLIEDHLSQTQALGRADNAVIRVEFEPPPIEKTISPAQCSSLILGAGFPSLSLDNVATVNACTVTCGSFIQTNRQRVGICNNGPATASATATISSEGAGSASTSASVPANTSQLFTGTPVLNKSLTAFRRSNMRIVASVIPGTFHVRGAPN